MEDEKKEQADRSASDSLEQMFTAFGQAIGEIFKDPELKAKAKELGDAATVSMEALGRRFPERLYNRAVVIVLQARLGKGGFSSGQRKEHLRQERNYKAPRIQKRDNKNSRQEEKVK